MVSVTFFAARHPMRGGFVEQKSAVTEIDCYRVLRELSDYLEADLPPQLRLEIEKHLQECDHCKAVYDGLKNVVRLVGDEKAIALPEGFSERLYQRILSVA
jgi:predicted anti-sigma-YlaC factor YlaD